MDRPSRRGERDLSLCRRRPWMKSSAGDQLIWTRQGSTSRAVAALSKIYRQVSWLMRATLFPHMLGPSPEVMSILSILLWIETGPFRPHADIFADAVRIDRAFRRPQAYVWM